MSSINVKSTLLFVVNQGSGQHGLDYQKVIMNFFEEKSSYSYSVFLFNSGEDCASLSRLITSSRPDVVVAVGGDGTIKLVAEMIAGTSAILGIIPAGSANGMAKDLNIPLDPEEALNFLLHTKSREIHLTEINGELCIHLADIGFNAYVVRKFEMMNHRGMWGYVKAAWKVLLRHRKMNVIIEAAGRQVKRTAVMVVIANATSYGNGVTVNPVGALDDDLFEVIIIRKISVSEIFKMRFSEKPRFESSKTECIQASRVEINARSAVHFQLDGEYLGKVHRLKASIFPGRLKVICNDL